MTLTTTDSDRGIKAIGTFYTNQINSIGTAFALISDRIGITSNIDFTVSTTNLTTITSKGAIIQADDITIGKTGNATLTLIANQVTLTTSQIFLDATSIFIGPNTATGKVIVENTGIQFGATSNALLNSYEEDSYTGMLSNSSPSTTTVTFKFIRIGKVVTVSLMTILSVYTLTNSLVIFTTVIPAKYCPTANMTVMGRQSNMASLSFTISSAGVIGLEASGLIPISLNGARISGSYCLT